MGGLPGQQTCSLLNEEVREDRGGLSVLECLCLSVNHSQETTVRNPPGSSTSFHWFCPGTDVPLDLHKLHLFNNSEDGRSKLHHNPLALRGTEGSWSTGSCRATSKQQGLQ